MGSLGTGGEECPNSPGLVPYRTVNVSFVSSAEVKDQEMMTVVSVELALTTRGKLSSNGYILRSVTIKNAFYL